jgi:hypothetical protein
VAQKEEFQAETRVIREELASVKGELATAKEEKHDL